MSRKAEPEPKAEHFRFFPRGGRYGGSRVNRKEKTE